MGDFTDKVSRKDFIEKAREMGWVTESDFYDLVKIYNAARRAEDKSLDRLMKKIMDTDITNVAGRKALFEEIKADKTLNKLKSKPVLNTKGAGQNDMTQEELDVQIKKYNDLMAKQWEVEIHYPGTKDKEGKILPWSDMEFAFGEIYNQLRTLAAPAVIQMGKLDLLQKTAEFQEYYTTSPSKGRGELIAGYNPETFEIYAGNRKLMQGIPEEYVPEALRHMEELADVCREMAEATDDKMQKDFFLKVASLTDNATKGNLMKLETDDPMIDRLFSVSNGFVKDPLEENIKGLGDIYEPYMTVLNGFYDMVPVAIQKEDMLTNGVTDEKKAKYLEDLYAANKKITEAYDKLAAVDNKGQYDKYINNSFDTLTGLGGSNRDAAYVYGFMRGQNRAIKNGWDYNELDVLGIVGELDAVLTKRERQIDYRRNHEKSEENLKKVEEDAKALADQRAAFNVFKNEVWDTEVKTAEDKLKIVSGLKKFIKDHPSDMKEEISLYGYMTDGDLKKLDDIEKVCLDKYQVEFENKMHEMMEQGRYRELLELMTDVTIANADRSTRTAEDKARDKAIGSFAEKYIADPQKYKGMLTEFFNEAGKLNGEWSVKAGQEKEEMIERIKRGEIPGTEQLVGDDKAVTEVAYDIVDKTSPTVGKLRAKTVPLELFTMGLPDMPDPRPDPSHLEAEIPMVLGGIWIAKIQAMGQEAYLDSRNDLPKEELTRLSLLGMKTDQNSGKYGYELNPDAKNENEYFSKIPSDIKKIREADTSEKLEAFDKESVKKAQQITELGVIFKDLQYQATEKLKNLESMKKEGHVNSSEYDDMHKALKYFVDMNPEKVNIMCMKDRLDDLAKASKDYETTHNVWNKAVFKGGYGDRRLQMSKELQTFAKEQKSLVEAQSKGLNIHDTVQAMKNKGRETFRRIEVEKSRRKIDLKELKGPEEKKAEEKKAPKKAEPEKAEPKKKQERKKY